MPRRREVEAALGDDALATSVGERQRLGAAQTRVVLRLSRSDASDDTPWVAETVCFLFNAQGDVLDIHRANDERSRPRDRDDDEPITIRCAKSKDSPERQRVVLSLPALDASVEVVGFLVSYTTDQIARRPRLNAFSATIDVSEDVHDRSDELGLSTSASGDPQSARIYSYTHESQPKNVLVNYVVLCKLFRDPDNRSEWILHGISGCGEVRSSVNAVLAEAMQVFLLDIIPEIEIAHRNALNTVASICAALSRREVLDIEQYFRDEGVTGEEFARLLLLVLLKSRPELRRLSRATALVALLFEMFEQIDINGDGKVDWEELTTFCVSLGLIATREQQIGGPVSFGSTYHQQLVGPHTRTFPYQIRRIRSLPALRIVAVIQNKCANVLIYDADMVFLYEFNHVCRVGREENTSLAVLDVDYIQARNWLVVSSSDHLLTFWSVVNANSGAYVFAFKLGSRCPLPDIQWCGNALNRLVTFSSEGVQVWDVEAKRVARRMTHHKDRITGCLEIQLEVAMLATCSFDATIAVLHVPSLELAFELRGHVQGVQQMDYHARGGILLSSGFEHQAYCWSIPSQSLLTTLGGHQAPLIGARFVSHTTSSTVAIVITGDEQGRFRLWDISRCLGRHTTELAVVLQSFEIVTPNLCKFHTFACGILGSYSKGIKKQRDSSRDLADVFTGSFRLFRFRAIAHADDMAPPSHVTFNSISNCFVGSVDGVITVWSASSGSKIEEPVIIRDCDVCAIVFDMPRQRKLFVATSDGAIRLYNPITSEMLTKTMVHDGIISNLIYCPRSSCLVSTGFDRQIAISLSSAGKTDIDVLRTVENAHDSCISATAYSEDLELVATGDDAGNLHVYDFQRLYLLFRCEGHHDQIQVLHFHFSAPLLFSGDVRGIVFLWDIIIHGPTYQIQPIMQLALSCSNHLLALSRSSSVGPSRMSSRPSTALSLPLEVTSPISSILCTPETKHSNTGYVYVGTSSGVVWGWDFRVLTNYARRNGVGKAFEYHFTESPRCSERSKDYNALLRVIHKTSVLKLRGEDIHNRNVPLDTQSGYNGTALNVLQSCEASCLWQAHAAQVTQLHLLPYPARMFSVSLDGTIRVWNASHTCIGTISSATKADKSGSLGCSKLPGSATLGSSWKFTHHRSLAHESRNLHIQIAREILQRAKRRLATTRRSSQHEAIIVQESTEASDEPEFAVDQSRTPELSRSLASAERLLANHMAFSKESRQSGVKRGLFGAEEETLLREFARGPHMQHEKQIRSRLAPLMLVSPKPSNSRKNYSFHPEGNEIDLPVMRTMRHFPAEVEKRRSLEKRGGARLQVPDISLSPFLQSRLLVPDTLPKSTPKKRLTAGTLSFTMEAHATVTEDITLPALDREAIPLEPSKNVGQYPYCNNNQAHKQTTRDRLASHASSPCLPIHPLIAPSDPQKNTATAPPTLESVGSRSNIERKMRIYEGSDVFHISGKGDDTTSEFEHGGDDNRRQRHRPISQRQLSQPQLTIRQNTEFETYRDLPETTPARKRQSQSTLPTAPASAPTSNPYGPHYTVKQVVDFSGIIARFDSDYSGDIDKSEWMRMMQSCRPIFGSSDLEATERLFHSIDRDDSGKISLQEILPMVFSKATPDQLQKMRQSIQARIDAAPAAMGAAATNGLKI